MADDSALYLVAATHGLCVGLLFIPSTRVPPFVVGGKTSSCLVCRTSPVLFCWLTTTPFYWIPKRTVFAWDCCSFVARVVPRCRRFIPPPRSPAGHRVAHQRGGEGAQECRAGGGRARTQTGENSSVGVVLRETCAALGRHAHGQSISALECLCLVQCVRIVL